MHPRSAAQTDPGRKRQINEDAFHADDDLGFYVVADGVGGHSKGEVASQEAVEQLVGWVRGQRHELEALSRKVADGQHEARWEIRRLLEGGVKSACYMVFGMAELDPDKRGMSTTMSCVFVAGDTCYAAHVGDSRVYRVRGGEVLQVTEDHTLINYKVKQGLISAAEAATMSGKNVITRAVGHKDYVQVDTADLDARAGDRFFLCTDGMHGYIDDPRELVELIGAGPLEDGTAAAIALACERGGKDNITVVALEMID
jgi:protein phosphatase